MWIDGPLIEVVIEHAKLCIQSKFTSKRLSFFPCYISPPLKVICFKKSWDF